MWIKLAIFVGSMAALASVIAGAGQSDGVHETRPHQGRWCYGKTPMQTFLDALPIAREKLLPAA